MMLAQACGGMQDQHLAQNYVLSQQAQAPAKARGQSPWGDTLNLQYKQIKQPLEEGWKSVTKQQTQVPPPISPKKPSVYFWSTQDMHQGLLPSHCSPSGRKARTKLLEPLSCF